MRRYFLIFCLAAGLDLLIGARDIGLVLHGGLIDPDSYMRLLRIQQGLSQGHLVNMVRRDDSGTPIIIEWSRLFDAALVALATPLAPFLGWHRALFASGVASGPLGAGLLGAALAFAAAPLSERRFMWMAPVIGLLLPGIRGYASFGIIHYHLVMLAAAAMTAGFALRARHGSRRMGLAAGMAGGFAIWIMPETMPFVLFAFIGLGWRWLHRPIGPAMAWLGAGFAGVLALGTAIDPPHGGFFAPEIDRISIIYLLLGLAVLGVTALLARLDRLEFSHGRRNLLGILAALIGFAAWLARYPQLAIGPYALMTPREMRQFFGAMAETQPVHGAEEAFLLLGPGAAALVYCLHRAWRMRNTPQEAGACVIAAAAGLFGLALTARFVIFQQFPAGFAAALLPVALSDASRRLAARPARAAAARIGMIFTCLIAPYTPSIAMAAVHAPRRDAKLPSCAMRHIAPLLAPTSGQVVLARMGETPELLYRSRIITVGSLYQHGIPAYLRARAAWRSPVKSYPSPAVIATRARFVLFCPARHYAPVKGAPKNSLWNELSRNRPPAWLKQTGADKSTGFRLYRISPVGPTRAPSK
ncbi:MAG TPA: hypothetical protein VFN77_03900 [Acetobacteraceae bacterium]|nr:hypothetical protein [Acetobacteraceae bacterium]